ncbi:hypothetical protein LEMA_P045380.1 [Plenodomus lingam JN3]|uniref:MSP domain-containing protein n=2 Tax=Leptosphaeria maculans TaxID=5022 RepID=E5R464_LEPMJ|nr:hypothetical protein LEMA_P045380.1 [Plenodomus lingam JN3]CBX91832.1 hypothetical protein LEMA_P045380.1 [Plenodomus lingam JN3]
MKEDPAPDAKCRDKFLVQSVLITADKEFANVGSLWTHIEQTAKSSIQEKKIRVLFLPADDSASTPARTNGVSRDSLLASSPSPEAVTPQRGVPEASGPVSVPSERPSGSKHLGEIQNETFSSASTGSLRSTVNAAAASVSNALPSTASLQAQLDEAKAEIARLTQQVSESAGLRQRRADPSSRSTATTSAATVSPPVNAGGVPVHITAILCLLSFLIAYFLF